MKRLTLITALVAGMAGMALSASALTKQELHDAKEAEGFTVRDVAEWTLVGEVDNKRKYDVAYEHDGEFAIAQVLVVDEGQPGETATVIGTRLTVQPETTTFAERLTTFLRSMESGAVWAIERVSLSEADATATVHVYQTNGSTLTRKTYVVKERGGTFNFQELI